ncbi:MAG: hypothetical protein LBI72_06605 [Flavobacteriaceae bacterium]|jgi:ABC-type molybdate transport system permease subunit|nr:hypothetical protein [Flavobacteriaceae bacterium]
MKTLLFYTALGIAISIYLLQKNHIVLPLWVNNYVNDFLTLPLVLTLGLYLIRKIKREHTLKLPLLLVLLTAFAYSIYFEWYLPQYHIRYTGDWWDCVMYFCGAIVFYKLQSVSSE